MNGKISDFRLCESVLRLACAQRNQGFVDVPIEFEASTDSNALFIQRAKNIGQTMYEIVHAYIQESPRILGKPLIEKSEDKSQFFIYLASWIRNLIYADDVFEESKSEDLTLETLSQNPFVWLVMKNLFCPYYGIPLNNIKIIRGDTPYVDIAKFYEHNELENNGRGNYPFIFINTGVNNSLAHDAFLLVEAIKGHGLCPTESIKEIFQSVFLENLVGSVKLAYVHNVKVFEFLTLVMNILGIGPDLSKAVVERVECFKKEAQNHSSPTIWWLYGLTEAMLGSVRGDDWSTHQALEPYVKQFWDKVENYKKAKAKKGNREGVSFEELLRLREQETVSYKADPNKSLQALLSTDRVW